MTGSLQVTSVIVFGIIFICHTCIGNDATAVTGESSNDREVENSDIEDVKKEVLPIVDCFAVGKSISKIMYDSFDPGDVGNEGAIVKFWLSSRIQKKRVEVHADPVRFKLNSANFVPERNTVVIVHGFLSNARSFWVKDMEDALLKMADLNIIVVNWASGGRAWNYRQSVESIGLVGDVIARFLRQIVDVTRSGNTSANLKWGKLHLIGHSLGAHVCGVAAKKYTEGESSWIISRITGLDPAQPCYHTNDMSLRLDKSDAPFVDNIHSNGLLYTKLGLGLPPAEGHADFYLNGGMIQLPGCNQSTLDPDFSGLKNFKDLVAVASCNHGRSYIYFTGSINGAVSNKCKYEGHLWDGTPEGALKLISEKCDSANCVEMGMRAIGNNDQRYHDDQHETYYVLISDPASYCGKDELEKSQNWWSKVMDPIISPINSFWNKFTNGNATSK